MELTEIRDEVLSLRRVVEVGLAGIGRTLGVLGEDTRSLGRMVSLLAEEQARFARGQGEFGERLSLMLAGQARARTEELERWMQLEERLNRLETR